MDEIKTLIKKVLVQNKTSFPENMDPPKSQYPTTVIPANKKAPTLEGGLSKKLVAFGISNMISAH